MATARAAADELGGDRTAATQARVGRAPATPKRFIPELLPLQHKYDVWSRADRASPVVSWSMAVHPILVSSCLAGVPCRYDGNARPNAEIVAAVEEGRAVPACAEQLGGLPTPRPAAEIQGGDGNDVLRGTAAVITDQGEDVTAEFVAGAESVTALALAHGITEAVLQARSPSAGAV